MAKKKILMLAGDFVEDYEIMVPYQMLLYGGSRCRMWSAPARRRATSIATAVHDFEGHQTYTEKRGHGSTINADFDALWIAPPMTGSSCPAAVLPSICA